MNQKTAYSVTGVAVIVFIIDQLVKYYFLVNQSVRIKVGFYGVSLSFNNGIWGGSSISMTVSIFVVLGLVFLWSYRRYMWMTGTLLMGVLSNLLDRTLHGRVLDYLEIYQLSFNLADILIVLGAIGALLQVASHRRIFH